jgi:hypothetical protein
MGSRVSLLHDCLDVTDVSGPKELLLRVVHAPIEESSGAKLIGYKLDDVLKVVNFQTEPALDALGWRYREKMKQQWPPSYRFQLLKRSWHAVVVPDSWSGTEQTCVLQMASSPDARTLENVEIDVDDARVAASYASRFNRNQCQALSSAGMVPPDSHEEAGTERPLMHSIRAADARAEDAAPTVRVAATIACEVVSSSYPSMIPVGGFCTLAPYAEKEVHKFVFDGSEDFSEIPQAYFHYAAFSSGGKEYVCDIQGVEEDDGCFLLVDPCVLRANLPTLKDLVGVIANTQGHGRSMTGPTVERFDALHPKCGEACKVFDPQRRSALRNGKTGLCGIGPTCGFGR